ncbi:jg14459 [Pararge aegeria aegeria]|uniref:Jg14459 protein n=1 Tax=Pararge aegeria aegeria TaxID=348720 RepID=A0A8S4RZ76_9NEOP|nr:jg14459 [Pararge aegeria aegeria]
MCACKQKRASFLIEDILCETKPHKHLSHEPLESLTCSKKPEVFGICAVTTPVIEFANQNVASKTPKVANTDNKGFSIANLASSEPGSCKGLTSLATEDGCKFSISKLTTGDFGKDCSTSKNATHSSNPNRNEELITKLNVVTEVQRELEIVKLKVNLEQRRNTYPIYPTPIKANLPWTPYRLKNSGYPMESRHPMSFYSDPMLKTEQILRNQLAVNRLVTNPYSLRQVYGFDGG